VKFTSYHPRATDQPSAVARDGVELSETARLEAFSDGVFAIAITLLVLEIKVPPAHTAGGGGLLAALGALWPSYIGYVITFITIGIMWVNHHAMFRYIRRADRWCLLINVAFLLCLSFLPFPTAVLAEHLNDPEGRRVATVFYGAALTVMAILYNVLWWYGTRRGRLLGPDIDLEGVRTISKRYRFGPLLYAAATAIAFVNVAVSLTLHASLAVLFALPEVESRISARRSQATRH
jgi:uncharacterized membrane protein